MMLMRLPGVYRPQEDTELLLGTLLAEGPVRGSRVLDIGTGTGRVALALARAGAWEVVAVDLSRRAVLGARFNSLMNRAPVRVHRGDLFSGVAGRFDLIVANPPYVPCGSGGPRPHSRARAWDAGRDGRLHIDRICRRARAHLAERGELWLVHSAVCDAQRTLDVCDQNGLAAQIVAKEHIPFGPVMRERTGWMRACGLLGPDQESEELVVIRACPVG
jgi:release factor glutamine methyltransferase